MGRKSKGKSFEPSEVAKWIFPEDWRHFVVDVEEVMMQLHREGKITVTQDGLEVAKDQIPQGEIRITVPC